jgi:3'-phosphoadenosine 5'-phosphosulfate (PAPS) 3'-phosphatase
LFVHSFYTSLLGMELTPKMLKRDFKSVGSCGLRLCMIAEGSRNIYASSGESGSVWDYASGAVILKEAGGNITDLKGKPLDFLSEDYKFKSGTLSSGSKEIFERAIQIREITQTRL